MAPSVPFIDLKAQYLSLKSELDAAIANVPESAQFVLGREVEAFERDFAAFCGSAHAVAVNSGTSALHLALLALGIGEGDEVITVSMTFVATVAAIQYTGAKPVLVDIDPVSCCMDPDLLTAAITSRTKAILPVHLYGQPADMTAILEIAQRNGLAVIEDAAQAHGARCGSKRAGSLGDAGCFSFYPTKNLGAFGEGGAVVTDRDDVAQRIRMLRDWGQERKSEHHMPGFNYRMDAIQGAVLGVKLGRLEQWNAARIHHAAAYSRRLSTTPLALPQVAEGSESVYYVYAVRHAERDRLRAALAAADIGCGIHYPIPVHTSPAYQSLGYSPGDFPETEALAREELSLPMFPELSTAQIDAVTAAIEQFFDD